MKIYQTTAKLGYMQFAYLIRLDKSDNGYNYICIDTVNTDIDDYKIGGIVKDLEDYYVEESTYKLIDSPLNGTYLFDYWISHHK